MSKLDELDMRDLRALLVQVIESTGTERDGAIAEAKKKLDANRTFRSNHSTKLIKVRVRRKTDDLLELFSWKYGTRGEVVDRAVALLDEKETPARDRSPAPRSAWPQTDDF